MMAQTQTLFTYKNQIKDTGTEILDQMRAFINTLIETSRNDAQLFRKILKQKIFQTGLFSQKQRSQLQQIFHDGHKFKMGMKISDDHPLLQDFGSQRFDISSTQLFRLIIKWIQDLSKLVQKKQQTMLERKYLKKFTIVGSLERQLFSIIEKRSEQVKIMEHKKQQHPQTIKQALSIKQDKQESLSQVQEVGFFKKFVDRVSTIFIPPSNQQLNIQKSQKQIPKFKKFQQDKSMSKIEASKDLKRLEEIRQQRVLKQQKKIKKIQHQKHKSIIFQSWRYNIPGSPISQFLQSMSTLNKNKQAQTFVNQQQTGLRSKYFQILRIVQKNQRKQKLSLVQKKIFSFSQYTYEFLREMVADRLLNLIQMLTDFRYKFDDIGQDIISFKNVDLVTFRVTDMLRARIMGNQKQIFLTFNALQQLHKRNEIKIVKVKNRFNQSMNDAIIVFQMKKIDKETGSIYTSPILCEYQLILSRNIAEAAQAKQKASQSLNHYLYELQRSTYGPFSELALIIATRDHRIQYLKLIQPRVVKNKIILKNYCYCGNGQMNESTKKKYQNLYYINYILDQNIVRGVSCQNWKDSLPKPFICGICQKVYGKIQNLFAVMRCDLCGFHVCSHCEFNADQISQKIRYRKLLEAVVCTIKMQSKTSSEVMDKLPQPQKKQFQMETNRIVEGQNKKLSQPNLQKIQNNNNHRKMTYSQTRKISSNDMQNNIALSQGVISQKQQKISPFQKKIRKMEQYKAIELSQNSFDIDKMRNSQVLSQSVAQLPEVDQLMKQQSNNNKPYQTLQMLLKNTNFQEVKQINFTVQFFKKNQLKSIGYEFGGSQHQTKAEKIKLALQDNIVRFNQGSSVKKFWGKVRSQFQKNAKQRDDSDEGQKIFYGILLKPSQIFSVAKQPFIIILYNHQKKNFYKLSHKDYQNGRTWLEIDQSDFNVKPFDCFFFIFDDEYERQEIVGEWSSQIIRYNPFLKYKRDSQASQQDDFNKLVKNLQKLKNVYDTELHLNDMYLKQINFERLIIQIPSNRHKLNTIKFLNLNSNSIVTIDGLQHLQFLTDLRIQRNLIQKFQITSTTLPSLQNLHLNYNCLRQLLANNHKKLQILYAEKNPLFKIKINNLVSLEILNFGGKNQLEEDVQQIKLSKLYKLRKLKISNTYLIQSITKFYADQFQNLIQLNLQVTNINIIKFPPKVEYLKMKGMDGQPINIPNLPNLKKLETQDLQIRSIYFSQKLVKVSIGCNQFLDPQGIPKVNSKYLKQFKFAIQLTDHQPIPIHNFLQSYIPNIETIKLSWIGQTQIGNFKNFKSLKNLQIEQCLAQINGIPQGLQTLIMTFLVNVNNIQFNFNISQQNLKQVKTLKLSSIPLKRFKPSQSIQSLILMGNNLKQIQKTNCNKLKSLKIQWNKLFKVNGLQQCFLPQIQQIVFNHTQIQCFQFTNKLLTLKILNLQKNKIKSMQWMGKQNLNSLVDLNLSDNIISHLVLFQSSTLKQICIVKNPLMNLVEDGLKLKSSLDKLPELIKTLQILMIFPVNDGKEDIEAQNYPNFQQVQQYFANGAFNQVYEIS